MQWDSLGFKENPLNTDPISQETLSLYTGHVKEIKACKNVLSESNTLTIIEGARGVGTTSFANYLRFSAQEKELYLTPCNEIRVERDWNIETLLSVIIANVVREIEFFQTEKIKKDRRFQDAKALSLRIAEAYRSFGISALGFGINYGKTAGITSQPAIVPSAVLGHHLEDLAQLVSSIGYKYGLLIQLNNLDIGVIHDEKKLQYLFNVMRDYFQTKNISWLIVGDVGLRRFIAQQVDRLDDIINYEIDLHPLTEKEYDELINRRIISFRYNPKITLPIDREVFIYLYEITQGRLRYIFGLLQRLINDLYIGDLTDRLTIDIAKPMVMQLARNRVARNELSQGEENTLRLLVNLNNSSVSNLANKAGKSINYTSNILSKLVRMNLVAVKKQGRNRNYTPDLDARIAYGE